MDFLPNFGVGSAVLAKNAAMASFFLATLLSTDTQTPF